MVTDPLLSRLAEALRECSDELAWEICGKYGTDRQQQSYQRHMAPVERARALLVEWEEKKP